MPSEVSLLNISDDVVRAIYDRAIEIGHPIPWETARKMAFEIATGITASDIANQ